MNKLNKNLKSKQAIYNYSLPRRKRTLTNYVQAILGVPTLTLFVLSFYLGLSKPWYFLLSAIGLFFSRQFIYVVWRYFKDENLSISLTFEARGIGYGFEHDNIQRWIFMDGVYELELEDDDWWVIRHSNGTWIYFPNGLLPEEEIASLEHNIAEANKVYEGEK